MSEISVNGFNMADFVRQNAQKMPYKRAIIVPSGRTDGGRCTYAQMTFKQLEEETNRYAHGFANIGIKRGMRVVVMVTPGFECFITFFALCKIGAVLVMIDPGIGLKSLKKCIEEAEPSAYIGVTKAQAARTLFKWSKKTIKIIITVGTKLFWGGYSFNELRSCNSEPYPIERMGKNETAALMFTSGSTGISKGAVYTHGILCSQVSFLQEIYKFEPNDIDLATFPLFSLFDICLGTTAIVPDMNASKPAEADPQKLIEEINDNGATVMFGSPALIDTLSRYGEKNKVVLPSLKMVISCGAPARNDILARLRGMLKDEAEIYTPYGATEALPISSIGSKQILGETAPITDSGGGTCVGRPNSHVQVRIIKITDEPIEKWSEDLVVKMGEIGEITVKGPIVTREYFKREQNTKLAKIADGSEVWHRMGDLGRIDEKGRIWFCGRKAHRVKTADKEYYSIQCERVFNQHPSVFRTALAGVKNTPVICVELEKNVSNIDETALFNELKEIGAKYPHTAGIKHFLIHPAFPVDIRHNAKINREMLSEWAFNKIKNNI